MSNLPHETIHTADTMVDARKDIIFRDEHYKEKFRIKDGERIKITVAYDGEEIIRKCRYLDDHHMYVGSTCLHVNEFMEKQTRVGNTYEPISNQEPLIDVVIVEKNKFPSDIEIDMTHSAIREILGGEPEIISKDKFSVIVKGIEGNGKMLVCGYDGDYLTSLHPYVAQTKKYELAALFPKEEKEEKAKPTLVERLEAGKAKAAEHNADKLPDTSKKTKNTTEL
jgi:hypothetical protein